MRGTVGPESRARNTEQVKSGCTGNQVYRHLAGGGRFFYVQSSELARAEEAIYRHRAKSSTRVWRFSQSNLRVKLGRLLSLMTITTDSKTSIS